MIKIYGLVDPRTNEIKYVGQTSRKLDLRLKEHIYDSIKRPRYSHKVNWINSLIKIHLLPEIKLLENVFTKSEEREKFWILKLIEDGCNLTNSTSGGEFCTFGSILSEDVRKGMSIKATKRSKGNKNVMWGKKHKESSKVKMSNKKIGIYDGNKNPMAKELFQYDENNNFVRKWSYAKECADFYKISRGNISAFANHNTNIDKNIDLPMKKYKMLKKIIFKFQ